MRRRLIIAARIWAVVSLALMAGCTSVNYQRPASPSIVYLRCHTQDTQPGGRVATLSEWTVGRRVGLRQVEVPIDVAEAPATIFAVGYGWQGFLDGPRYYGTSTTAVMTIHRYREVGR